MREDNRTIALERIERLLQLAEEVWSADRTLSKRYVELAWKLKLKYRVKLPSHLREKFCRKCRTLLKPGVSCRVRVRSGRVVKVCLTCGHAVRIPLGGRKGR
ncbi:MAG: hypothetical protein QXF66_01495 [Candidatus Hadarchaeales archaeon]